MSGSNNIIIILSERTSDDSTPLLLRYLGQPGSGCLGIITDLATEGEYRSHSAVQNIRTTDGRPPLTVLWRDCALPLRRENCAKVKNFTRK